MADHDDLPGRIHRLAEGLDHRSRPAAIVPVAGGTLRTAGGKDRIGPVESFAVGWTPDSKAIVSFPESGCATTVDDPPGVYLVNPANLRRTLLYRFENGRPFQTVLWRRDDPTANVAERIFARALYEGDLEGCCGEPSHGGRDLTAGVRWEGAKIAVSATAVDEPRPKLLDDPSTKLGPADLGIAYGTSSDGAFTTFSCNGYVWIIGGAGISTDRPTARYVGTLTKALILLLYCSVGDVPRTPTGGD